MNTFTKTLVIGTAILATAGTAIAVAGPGMGNFGSHAGMMQGMGGPGAGMGMGPGAGMMGGPNAMFERIPNLTAEQREQLTQLQARQHERMLSFKTEMMAQRGEVMAEMSQILTEQQRAALFGNMQPGTQLPGQK